MNEQTINEQAVSKYYKELFKDVPLELFCKKHNVSDSTIKNLISGKTANPGILTLAEITYPAHGSLDAIFGKDNESLKESAINAIKDMYEFHSAEREKIEEKHIANTRAHYEQHREDTIKNYERLLVEKDKQINLFKKIAFVCFGIACIGLMILITLLILEVMHPEKGWIKF